VGGVDGERRQHREDQLGEEAFEMRSVVVGQFVPVGEPDAGDFERRGDLVGEDRGGTRHELFDEVTDGAQLVDEVEAVGGGRPEPGRQLLHEPRDPHLEELVEVLAEDGEELRPLEQGQLGVLGQSEDPSVELQPRELAVEEPLRRVRQRGPLAVRFFRAFRVSVRGGIEVDVQPGHQTSVLGRSRCGAGPNSPGTRANVREGNEH